MQKPVNGVQPVVYQPPYTFHTKGAICPSWKILSISLECSLFSFLLHLTSLYMCNIRKKFQLININTAFKRWWCNYTHRQKPMLRIAINKKAKFTAFTLVAEHRSSQSYSNFKTSYTITLVSLQPQQNMSQLLGLWYNEGSCMKIILWRVDCWLESYSISSLQHPLLAMYPLPLVWYVGKP